MSDGIFAGPPSLPPPSPARQQLPPPPPFVPAPPQLGAVNYHSPVAPDAVDSGPRLKAVSPWGRLGAYFLEFILVFVTLGIGWLIWAATIGGAGQTPAKRLFNQRVINADSQRPA